MDEVFFVVQTPIFWFTTVFVGLLLSVFGAAIYDWLKMLVGKFSSRQRKRNEIEKERIEQEARKCAKSTKLIVLREGYFQRLRTAALFIYFMGLAMIFLGTLYANPTSITSLLSSSQESLQTEVVFSLPDTTIQRLAESFSDGWQPITYYRLRQLMGLMMMTSGLYVMAKSLKTSSRGAYWRRVLNRTRQLIEEDLENDTIKPDD